MLRCPDTALPLLQVPPGIVTGVELLRLELPPAEPASPADASKSVPYPPAVLSAASSAASFISSLRIMTSHESTNASIRRTVDALSNFSLTGEGPGEGPGGRGRGSVWGIGS